MIIIRRITPEVYKRCNFFSLIKYCSDELEIGTGERKFKLNWEIHLDTSSQRLLKMSAIAWAMDLISKDALIDLVDVREECFDSVVNTMWSKYGDMDIEEYITSKFRKYEETLETYVDEDGAYERAREEYED